MTDHLHRCSSNPRFAAIVSADCVTRENSELTKVGEIHMHYDVYKYKVYFVHPIYRMMGRVDAFRSFF